MATEADSRAMPLHTKIVIGMIAGAALGGGLNLWLGAEDRLVEGIARHVTEPVGQLFLRLLLLLVVPLVFTSLTVGVAGLGELRRVGRVGGRALLYSIVFSAISVVIGLAVANTIRPGERIDASLAAELQAHWGSEASKKVESATASDADDQSPLMTVVKTLVPTNIVASVARETPDMMALMFFALFLGLGLTVVPDSAREPVVRVLEGAYEAVAACIGFVMKLAPYAVFALLFTMTSRFGFGLLTGLAWYVGAVLFALSLHMFGVYPLSVRYLSKISPLEFFRRIRTVMVTAFSTSSSNATLPTALRVTEKNLGVPKEINSFVLTVGATANQNGTALFEGVTVLFLAQLAGVDLTIAQQLLVLYLAILGGIGTAGVPSGSIPFVILVLATIGVNPALIAVVLGVDRLLDMCRTVLNVTGDITAATWVARAEGYELMPPAIDETVTGGGPVLSGQEA